MWKITNKITKSSWTTTNYETLKRYYNDERYIIENIY